MLIFVGYLILVATCVFMFGDSRLASGDKVAAFDTETIVAAGLVTLGGALVISRALRGIADLWIDQSASPGAAPPRPPEAVATPAPAAASPQPPPRVRRGRLARPPASPAPHKDVSSTAPKAPRKSRRKASPKAPE